jgi:hypothetical protein
MSGKPKNRMRVKPERRLVRTARSFTDSDMSKDVVVRSGVVLTIPSKKLHIQRARFFRTSLNKESVGLISVPGEIIRALVKRWITKYLEDLDHIL